MNSLIEYVEQLNCSDQAERTYAAEDIGYLNTSDGVPALLERLVREPSPAVREAIFQALIRIDGDPAIEGCVLLLGSEAPQIRNQAVDVLRRKGSRSIPFLRAVMRDGNRDVRKLVLDVLSGTPVAGAVEIYAAALGDDDLNLVITAVENLGKARSEEFRTRIEELLLAGSHAMLVTACVEALVGIGNKASWVVIRKRFPNLAALPDLYLAPCLKAVAALGSAHEFAEVASLLPLRAAHLRPAILSAIIATYPCSPSPELVEALLPALRAVAENGDPPLCRYQAVLALGFMATRDEVYSLLVACLSSPERLIRLGAIESLRKAARQGLDNMLARRAETETDEEVLQALTC